MPSPRKVSWINKDGSTSIAWQVRYKDRAGRRRAKQFETRKQASEFGDTVTSAIRDGKFVPDRDTVTIAEAAERWLAACRRGRNGRDPVEAHTLRVYELLVRLHIVPFMGGLKLTALTPARVKAFRDQDLLEGGRSRPMVKKVLGALSSICREAVADELMGVNPCDGIQLVTAARHKQRVVIPSKADVQVIVARAQRWTLDPPRAEARRGGRMVPVQPRISADRALWFYTMLRFIVSTGVRLSEARGAAIADLDLDARVYRVTQRADERSKIGPVKSGAGDRELELSEGLCADLRRWLALRPESDLLFPNDAGRPEMAQNIYRRFWLPLLVECGLATRTGGAGAAVAHETELGVHDLRHFHASLMIESGMAAKPLQEHMGHASIQVTMDVYGHLFQDEDARARRRALIVGADDALLLPSAYSYAGTATNPPPT
jgi:integrase